MTRYQPGDLSAIVADAFSPTTDFAQQSLGDAVEVTLRGIGATVTAGPACGGIESTKTVSELRHLSPVMRGDTRFLQRRKIALHSLIRQAWTRPAPEPTV
jgi:Glycine cleavage H-protein